VKGFCGKYRCIVIDISSISLKKGFNMRTKIAASSLLNAQLPQSIALAAS